MDFTDPQKLIERLEKAGSEPVPATPPVHAADIADALSDLDEPTQALIFSLLDDEMGAEVLAETDERTQERLFETLSEARLVRLLIEMDPDDAADALAAAPEEIRPVLLGGLDEDTRRSVSLLGEYEPESAGGIMTTEVVGVGSNETIRSALRKVREAEQIEAMSSVFVVDPASTLVGIVDLKRLLTADEDLTVGEVMNPNVISVLAEADQEEAAQLAERYHVTSLPVVDSAGRLKGVITLDDVLEVLGEEASEDMLRLAGTGVTHPTTEALRTRLVARAPWLSVTLAGTFLAGLIIEFIEKTWFSEAVAVDATFKSLLYFIPLIGGMAGNVGSQSSTIMVRGFATGEVDPGRPMRVLPGELSLALVIGLVSGVLVGVATALVHEPMAWLGVVVGVALPCAIFVAALTGTLVPFACRAVRVDPAYASGPFLLTVNDIAAYVIYFVVAIVLMDSLGVG